MDDGELGTIAAKSQVDVRHTERKYLCFSQLLKM